MKETCKTCRYWQSSKESEYGFCPILTDQLDPPYITMYQGTDGVDQMEYADWVHTHRDFGCIKHAK